MQNMADRRALFLLITLLFAVSNVHCEESNVSDVPGLSLDFYKLTCPKLEFIIRAFLLKEFATDIGQAAGLLRLHFHDCFVHGCQGTLLLDGPVSEKNALPNLSIRARAYAIINELKKQIEAQCPNVVSCTDIETIAARDSVLLSGGPPYPVLLGRRDGLLPALPDQILASLPSPLEGTDKQIPKFAAKGFDATDLVALSGAHTIGLARCITFNQRLFPTLDPTMNPIFAAILKLRCPALTVTEPTVPLDVTTPNLFDNVYYLNLLAHKGLLFSDQDLFTSGVTKSIVANFAVNPFAFFGAFAKSMTKLGQFGVLTGAAGEIRNTCNAVNAVVPPLPPLPPIPPLPPLGDQSNLADI